jgi:myo-inositol-1(or 4)-monophosphatase
MTLSRSEFHHLTEVAIRAARQGGAILLDYAKKGFQIHTKDQAINLVTEADLQSEEAVIQTIRHTFPDHQILSEEQGLQDIPTNPVKWIIDPLDGTTNFAHGFPMYNVSIGVEYEGACVLGVVFERECYC